MLESDERTAVWSLDRISRSVLPTVRLLLSAAGMGVKCVLVVDDDELVCWALEKELSSRGLIVHGVDNGSDAMTRIRSGSYRLAFLDIHLPDGNGLELVDPIREVSPETRIVVVSTEATPENKRLAFARGAWQFLEKPFELDDVIGLANSTFGDYSEKRRHERFLCRLPLRVTLVSHTQEEAALDLRNLGGTTVDIGPGGLRLETAYPLRIGQRVRASLSSTDDPCCKFVPPGVSAEVVWTEPADRGCTAGLRYLADPIPARIS
jgi:CheY-like chemotaxis protein